MLSGSEVILIGVIKGWSIIYYAPNAPTPTNWPEETEEVYNLLNDPTTSERETKFNTILLAENRWLWENDPNYIPALHHLVDICKERGLYVIIRFHEWYEPWPVDKKHFTSEDKVDIIIELNSWRDHVVSIAKEFKNEPQVIGIDPFNEPPPPKNGWTAKGYTDEEAQRIWRDNALQVIDAIHAVDPSYIVFISPLLGCLTLKNAVPWNRPNIVYTVHMYYGWDTERGVPYADAYWNAESELDFEYAYSVMDRHFQSEILNFRDEYNVPVMNSETSMCKVSYKTGNPAKNSERQFQDQLRLGAFRSLGQLYWQHDRNKSDKYWGLLDASNPQTWSVGGLLVRDAINMCYY